jgi:hypothetical protein
LSNALETKGLAGDQGFLRSLQTQGRGHFAIDQQRVREDAQYDGIFVLRTDTDYDAPTVAHIYKTLLDGGRHVPHGQEHHGYASHLPPM